MVISKYPPLKGSYLPEHHSKKQISEGCMCVLVKNYCVFTADSNIHSFVSDLHIHLFISSLVLCRFPTEVVKEKKIKISL